MKNSKLTLFLFLLLSGALLAGCSRKDENLSAYLNQWQVPVLKYRENNQVLQMKVVVHGDSPSRTITSVTVNTKGTDDPDDIKAVSQI